MDDGPDYGFGEQRAVAESHDHEAGRECEQRCGRPAAVYALDPVPNGWGGWYCEPCAGELKFEITDRLEGR